jgi:hypothetical protein
MIVINQLGEELELILSEPEKTGLLVDSIKGLGEPDVKINMTAVGLTDYTRLNSARYQPRTIEIKLIYYGNDIEASRLTAYKYFSSKEIVTLIFKTDYREVECTGIVEKNDPIIFSKECGCTISIKCPDPFLYGAGVHTTVFDAIEPLFKFPFSDAPEDELQFGNIRIIKNKSVYYVGEAETGVTINIYCLGIIRNLTIYNIGTGQQLGIRDDILEQLLGSSLMEGDDVTIVTIKNHKSAYLTRNGVTYNIINAISKRTGVNDWFELTSGDNIFTYTASTGDMDVMMNIKHRVLYKGV